MTSEAVVIHILPDGRMIVSMPMYTNEEGKMIADAVKEWFEDDEAPFIINRPVEIVVHK